MQLAQHPRELLAGHMEQDGIGEDAVETLLRQVEREQVLLPDFAAAICARHRGQVRRAFHAHRDVAQPCESDEVAPWPAAKIQDRERRAGLDVLQQRRNVLAHIMIPRALPERFGVPVVVPDGQLGNPGQLVRRQVHDGLRLPVLEPSSSGPRQPRADGRHAQRRADVPDAAAQPAMRRIGIQPRVPEHATP